jgi:xanthine dehydrogenase accessory factor
MVMGLRWCKGILRLDFASEMQTAVTKRNLDVSELPQFLQQLEGDAAVLVTVQSTRGSVPREVGAWMAVFASAVVGTVGGGHLEWDATAHARQLLHKAAVPAVMRYALGPSLGQCCGGEVVLHFETVGAHDRARLAQQLSDARVPVALFGGGHVGRAVAQVMLNLPLDLTWIDSRDQIFPPELSTRVRCEHSDPVQAAVADLAPRSCVLIMSFSHAEDLDVVAACLARQRERERGDLPYIGLIGSKTKWASFRQRLQARGYSEAELAHVTCPIGVSGIADKRPEVIAVAIAAQILLVPTEATRPV